MRAKLTAAFSTVLAVTAPGIPAQSYVGNTVATVAANSGVGNMNAACNAEFAGGARLCTSTDVMATSPPPTTGMPGWTLASTPLARVGTQGAMFLDVSGVELQRPVNCGAFSSLSSNTGALVASTSGLASSSCAASRPVACCRSGPLAEVIFSNGFEELP